MTDDEWIRVTRAIYRWSKPEFAARLGLTRSTVTRWEVEGARLHPRDRLAVEALIAREVARQSVTEGAA